MIPLARPNISFDEIADDIKAVVDSGWLTSGQYIQRFEKIVADYIGVNHAIATTSATTALHLSLVVSGVNFGDEVLVSDFTFPASGNAVIQAGATPVMVDCMQGGFCMDVADARAKITSNTRAIMVVDPFGQPTDMAAVIALADEYGLRVIEDAACALGAMRDNVQCGAWTGVGCFSFHPRKIITTGEGGMLTTNDDALAEQARLLRSHGGIRATVGMDFIENGYNYRLSEIQAVLGVSQMQKLDVILEERRALAAAYTERLLDVDGVTLPLEEEDGIGTYQSYVVMLDDTIDRNRVIASMRDAGIETTLGTYAMHAHQAFSQFGYKPGDLPNSWRAQNQSLTLPLFSNITLQEIDYVVETLKVNL